MSFCHYSLENVHMVNSRPVCQGPCKNFFTDTVDIVTSWALTVLLCVEAITEDARHWPS
jgi:hypothetical protein